MTPASTARFSFSPFRPPFTGLDLLLWCFFTGIFFIWPENLSLRGELPDSDDYMYLAQSLDWLNGQGWYDNIQHRLNPPEGVLIHFSRFAQLPFALAITIIKSVGIDAIHAAILTAICWPPLLLLAMFAALRWTALNVMPRDWAGLTAGLCLFTTSILAQFMPGHLDHHALMQLVIMLTLGCALRMLKQPEIRKWGILIGALLAFGQVIALETLPWLLLLSGLAVLWATCEGGIAAKAAARFGGSLCGVSILFLALSFPPSAWFAPNGFSFSFVYVLLTVGVAITCGGVALAELLPNKKWRYAAGFILPALGAGVFFYCFPNLIAGPYGAMDDGLTKLYMANIREAVPLTKFAPYWYGPPLILLAPILALAASVKFSWQARGPSRWQWGFAIPLLLAAITLTAFYQMRFISYAMAFCIIPLAELVRRCLLAIAGWRSRMTRALAKTAIILAIVINCILLALQIGMTQQRIGIHELVPILNDPKTYGAHPRLIFNMLNDGAELLLRTPHQVLAAPYNNLPGNRDSLKFFLTADPAEAERLARQRGAGLVLLSHNLPETKAEPSEAADICLIKPASQMNFARQLAMGIIPPWLKPISLPETANYWLFEVLPPESAP